jgi:antitoxin YefM
VPFATIVPVLVLQNYPYAMKCTPSGLTRGAVYGTFSGTGETTMTRTLPIVEARKQLNSLPEALCRDGEIDVMEITRRGKPVLAVLPWELYEAITETLDIMADREGLAKLRQSIREMEEGSTVSWEDAKLDLIK